MYECGYYFCKLTCQISHSKFSTVFLRKSPQKALSCRVGELWEKMFLVLHRFTLHFLKLFLTRILFFFYFPLHLSKKKKKQKMFKTFKLHTSYLTLFIHLQLLLIKWLQIQRVKWMEKKKKKLAKGISLYRKPSSIHFGKFDNFSIFEYIFTLNGWIVTT